MRSPLPPVACVVGFIDAINRGDVERLAGLMADDHQLQVLDEVAFVGKRANIEAWRGYASAFPQYVISPRHIVERDDTVVVLGHTTGSHLGLSDEDESRLTVIWRAHVRDGRLTLWQIIADTPAARADLGLAPDD